MKFSFVLNRNSKLVIYFQSKLPQPHYILKYINIITIKIIIKGFLDLAIYSNANSDTTSYSGLGYNYSNKYYDYL